MPIEMQCMLEVSANGTIYVHNPNTGTTILRINGMDREQVTAWEKELKDANITMLDITPDKVALSMTPDARAPNGVRRGGKPGV